MQRLHFVYDKTKLKAKLKKMIELSEKNPESNISFHIATAINGHQHRLFFNLKNGIIEYFDSNEQLKNYL